MVEAKTAWKNIIARALADYARGKGLDAGLVDASSVVAEKPPKKELGDLGFPMFSFAKLLRSSPAQIAQAMAVAVAADPEAATLGGAAAEQPRPQQHQRGQPDRGDRPPGQRQHRDAHHRGGQDPRGHRR